MKLFLLHTIKWVMLIVLLIVSTPAFVLDRIFTRILKKINEVENEQKI